MQQQNDRPLWIRNLVIGAGIVLLLALVLLAWGWDGVRERICRPLVDQARTVPADASLPAAEADAARPCVRPRIISATRLGLIAISSRSHTTLQEAQGSPQVSGGAKGRDGSQPVGLDGKLRARFQRSLPGGIHLFFPHHTCFSPSPSFFGYVPL